MRLLLDACVWGRSKAALVAQEHDVVWAGDWEEDPGDDEILARAAAKGRVLVTLDKDFGELAVRQGRRHAGIIRLVDISATSLAAACIQVLERYTDELRRGAIVPIEPSRVRLRLPDSMDSG